MVIQNTLDSIPIDLLYDILSRLPAKSVGRCRCVSKILALRLGSEDFKQLFFTKSLSRPRLLFALRYRNGDWAFYSSPQPQNPYEKSSVVVTADFHTKIRRSYNEPQLPDFIYASGLCYLSEVCEAENTSRVNVICNPSTRQYVVLPKLGTEREPTTTSCLGFDPIDKQFKVLLMDALGSHILTLGTAKLWWRRIQCPLLSLYPYKTDSNGICINGILYYLAQRAAPKSSVIVCFDVRSETFMRLIDVESLYYKLLNNKGKLCMISLRDINDERGFNIELQMCVLEDVEKQEWSKYVYTLPRSQDFWSGTVISVVGITATNEIVLSRTSTYSFRSRPVSFYYFNPEKNTLQSVQVHGFEDHGELRVFMDHVEDLHINDAKQFKPTTSKNVQVY